MPVPYPGVAFQVPAANQSVRVHDQDIALTPRISKLLNSLHLLPQNSVVGCILRVEPEATIEAEVFPTPAKEINPFSGSILANPSAAPRVFFSAKWTSWMISVRESLLVAASLRSASRAASAASIPCPNPSTTIRIV